MFQNFKTLFVLTSIVSMHSAHAYEIEDLRGYVGPHYRKATRPTLESAPPADRLQRFEVILKSLGIPSESIPDPSIFPASFLVTRSDFESNAPILDPDAGLRRYLFVDDQGTSLFRDFFSSLMPEGLLEFRSNFIKNGESQNTAELLARLDRIKKQVRDPNETRPLAGLKILIDPGHMGTPEWDEDTGKFVSIQGKKVSEGQLNLWTALLAAKEFEELGATVILTRTEDGTVSPLAVESFDVSPFLNQYFYNSLDGWMNSYLSLPPSGMLSAVKNAPETKKAFTAQQRTQFFISGADLEARSALIDQQKPDIVIDIHYDANQSNQLQNADNTIEAFVPGGIRASETGSRLVRGLMMNHLLENRRWNTSVDLASEMIQGMSESLGLKLQSAPEFITSIKVKDGVYARNLYITRRNTSSLMVYLECLHYDHVSEFSRLAKLDQVGTYHEQTFRYPSRLNEVVRGIRNGFLRHFQK